jgi:hypothetical protein
MQLTTIHNLLMCDCFPLSKLEKLVIEQSEQPQIAILGAAALYFDAQ